MRFFTAFVLPASDIAVPRTPPTPPIVKKRLPQLFVVLAAAIYAPACSVSDAPNRPLPTDLENNAVSLAKQGGGGVVSVVVTPATSSIAAGATVQLSAKGYNASGGVKNGTKFTWSSTNTGVATVTSTGLVRGIAVGTATIRALAQQTSVSGTATVTVTAAPPPPTTAQTLVAAGDIAVCSTPYDEATADLLDNIPGTVALLGDNAYPDGSTADYANCYDPTWGRHKARTKPSIGNHEYQSGGTAYFNYFGAAAGSPSQGYYSYDLGDWHIIVLNSNCGFVACAVGSAQETWLRADLQANTRACILAYWHHPRFSSDASHGSNVNVAPFWAALYEFRADVVLNGHAHVYERFARQTPAALADANGIRQFTVGTGGKSPFYGWGTVKANSEVRHNQTFGVLRLALGATGYSWDFVPVAGSTWTDSGTTACH